jgi:Uma2 family endonuclease
LKLEGASWGMQVLRRCFTVTQYHQMAAAGIFSPDERVELINGEILSMAAIGFRHASYVLRLNSLFSKLLQDKALVSVQNPLRLSDLSEPQPDIALLRPRDDFYETSLPQASDVLLLVEVADSSIDYDRNTKIPLYAQHGIPEVWLVDVEQVMIYVYRYPSATGYGSVQHYPTDQSIDCLAFPSRMFSLVSGELPA